jgi:hypothetical protein
VVSELEGRAIVNDNPLMPITQQNAEAHGSDPNDTSILNDKKSDRGSNAFWIDTEMQPAKVKGEYACRRSSIVDPPNGWLTFKPGATRSGAQHSAANFDDPETRPLCERCVMTETTAGPVMQDAMYNSTLQIVQSLEAVVIVVEREHHARSIPTAPNAAAARHGPDITQKGAGHSVGWYEGDIRLVERRNVQPQQPCLISAIGKVKDGLTHLNNGEMLYAFTVNGPSPYTQE